MGREDWWSPKLLLNSYLQEALELGGPSVTIEGPFCADCL